MRGLCVESSGNGLHLVDEFVLEKHIAFECLQVNSADLLLDCFDFFNACLGSSHENCVPFNYHPHGFIVRGLSAELKHEVADLVLLVRHMKLVVLLRNQKIRAVKILSSSHLHLVVVSREQMLEQVQKLIRVVHLAQVQEVISQCIYYSRQVYYFLLFDAKVLLFLQFLYQSLEHTHSVL